MVKVIECQCCIDDGAKHMLHALIGDDIKRLQEMKSKEVEGAINYLKDLQIAITELTSCPSGTIYDQVISLFQKND